MFDNSCVVDSKIGNIIPVDWIYSPILIMYSDQQENKPTPPEEQQIYIVKHCLRWIYIYEVYFPDLAARINITDSFCRLACVFLGSDNLFLEATIQTLIEMCFKQMMSRSRQQLDFDKPVQGKQMIIGL